MAFMSRHTGDTAGLCILKLAPFHVLANESGVHTANDHLQHMETPARVCAADPELLLAPVLSRGSHGQSGSRERNKVVGGTDGTRDRGHGGEAVGVCSEGTKGLAQPAVKG